MSLPIKAQNTCYEIGMFDWTQGTQFRAWLYRSAEELGTFLCFPPTLQNATRLNGIFNVALTAALRAKAHHLAKQAIHEGKAVPMPHCYASRLSPDVGKGSSSTTTEGNPSRSPSGHPSMDPTKPKLVSGIKRPRPDGEEETQDGLCWASAKDGQMRELDALAPEDEVALLQYFAYMIQDACGHRSESIKRGLHVQATALTFFKRFFLSNSMLDFDPKVVLMACVFLAGKVEYEYIRLSELKDVFGEKYGRKIIEFEGCLLQGLGFCLKAYHPYNPFFGLINGLEKVNHVKKLGLTPDSLSRLCTAGQETIDLILPTDLPLLHAPARIALAVLVTCAAECDLMEPVAEYLSYCFEEEDEYDTIMKEVALIRPAVEAAQEEVPKSPTERKESRIEDWRAAMTRLKKAARWGGKGEGKKRKKSKGGAAGECNGSATDLGKYGDGDKT